MFVQGVVIAIAVSLSSGCVPWQRRNTDTPCAPAYRQLAGARAWVAAGDATRALAAADAADAVCLGEPGRALRDDALMSLGFPPALRAAYAEYRHAIFERDEHVRAGQLGRPLRAAEASRVAARVMLERGIVEVGLAAPVTPSEHAIKAMLAALVLADRGDVKGGLATLDGVAVADRHPDLEVIASALLAKEHPVEAARRASRALFAVEWAAETSVLPVRTVGEEVGLPESFVGSPAGSYVAAAANGIAIWRGDTGELVHWIATPTAITGIGFSPGERLVAFGGVDNRLRIADVLTGRILLVLPRTEDRAYIRNIAFGPGRDEITATASETVDDQPAMTGKLVTWSLRTSAVVRELDAVPSQFGPFAIGAGVVVGSETALVRYDGGTARWRAPGVAMLSADRDGSLRFEREHAVAVLDAETGRARPMTLREQGRLMWVGAAAHLALRDRENDREVVRVDHGRETVVGYGMVDGWGNFAMVLRARAAGISDTRSGRHLGIELHAEEVELPSVRFVSPTAILIEDGMGLARLDRSGTWRPCGDRVRIPHGAVPTVGKPVLIYDRSGYALADATTCAVTRRLGETKPSLRDYDPDHPIFQLERVAAGREGLGDELDGDSEIVESGGGAVWLLGERGIERRATNAKPVRVDPSVLVIGEPDGRETFEHVQQASAGGGRIALLVDGHVTVTDGNRRWTIAIGDGAARIALGSDGKTLVVARPRTLTWIDVEGGRPVAESWRQGSTWRTVIGDRVVGHAPVIGTPSELAWHVNGRRLPAFVAWSRQGASR